MMKELSKTEIEYVSGAGFIQDGFASVGGWLGNLGYDLISSTLTVELPIIGEVSLKNMFPDLGNSIGNALGSVAGGTIEAGLAGIPFFGYFINKVLGN
jgi:hypothetical protein